MMTECNNNSRECSNTHPCVCKNVKCEFHGRCCDCIARHLGHGSLPHCADPVLQAKLDAARSDN